MKKLLIINAIILFALSCGKPHTMVIPCYDTYVVMGENTTEYRCYWYTIMDTYKVRICDGDTTVLNCFNSVKITPKPCYYENK